MLSKRIKEQRNKLGLSQMALAEKIGVTQQAVGKWECEKAHPDIEMLRRLADLFRVSTDYLLGRTDESYYLLPPDSPLYKTTLDKIKLAANVSSAKEIGLYDKSKLSEETIKKLIAITEQIKKEIADD